MRREILGICSLAALAASFLMSSLKDCHRVWGLEDLSFAHSSSRSVHSFWPLVCIALLSCLSCNRPIGQVHRSLPMKGAFAGVNLAATILWLVGIPGMSLDQSLMLFSSSSLA